MRLKRRKFSIQAFVALSVLGAPLINLNVPSISPMSELTIQVMDQDGPRSQMDIQLFNDDKTYNSQFTTNARGFAASTHSQDSTTKHLISLKPGRYQAIISQENDKKEDVKIFVSEDDYLEKIIYLQSGAEKINANAGPTQYTKPGKSITLDASASSVRDTLEKDNQNGISDYRWKMVSRPSASKIKFKSDKEAKSQFTPDVKGEYQFELTVSNGTVEGKVKHIVQVDLPYKSLQDIPIRVGGHTTVLIGKIAYLIGGWNQEFYNSLYSFDLVKKRWRQGNAMQTPRSYHASAVVNGRIYVFGGRNAQFRSGMSSVEYFQPSTGVWSKAAPMPTPRYSFVALNVNGLIYTLGGVNGERVVEIYNPITNVWKTGPSLPRPRLQHTGQYINGEIYLAGGKESNILDVYDIQTQEWHEAPPLPTGRYYLSSAVLNDQFFVIGGHGTSKSGEPSVELFDPKTETWITKNPLPFAIDTHSTVSYNSRIYIFGGESEFGSSYPIPDTFEYDPRFDSI